MDSDDIQIGRVLSRREALALIGGAAIFVACGPDGTPAASPAVPTSAVPGATAARTAAPGGAAAATGALPACVVRPEQTEGPFYVDEKLERSDIRSDPSTGQVSPGAPLALAFNVLRVSGASCAPLAGAIVDVWHCDAAGVYSDVGGSGAGQKFLRGHQVSDTNGKAAFTTVYPGWYGGRTVHVHFKIRTSAAAGASEFTSQLYFDDSLTDQVLQQQPYAQRGQRTTRNAGDGPYRNGGSQLLLNVTPSGTDYAATFDIGLAM